jgi:ABC-type glycerol-3-phosphate transport system substrate-binding protein
MKRVLATGVACVAVVSLAACGGGGDDDSSASATTTTEAATTTAAPFEATKAEADIRATYATFFNDQTPTDVAVKLLEEGESLRSAIDEQKKSGAAAGLSTNIKAVQFQSETLADVNFDIALKGAVVAPNTKGQAKFIDGTWKVDKALFCTLLGLAGQTPPACAQP